MLNKDRKLRVFVKVAMFSLFTCDLSGWKQIYQSASQESNDEETNHESKEVNSGNSNQDVRLNFGKNTKPFISSSFAVIISC